MKKDEDILLGSKILNLIQPQCKKNVLKDTPKRYIKALKELTSYNTNKDDIDKYFVFFSSSSKNGLIIIKNIFFSSLCEHHILPYFGYINIGYIPNGKILGLSKFRRIIDCFTKRLSIQEELTYQIFDLFNTKLRPKALIITVEAKHTCSLVRGVKEQLLTIKTVKKSDYFNKNKGSQDEFFYAISSNHLQLDK
ncbi:MAG: GTP cyclohydrolase I [Candidatus Roizmanbacteria bacterium]|nr:MAG: GTP cyclohydrolase I [Candidatus Roizmanbacteria bacterium]